MEDISILRNRALRINVSELGRRFLTVLEYLWAIALVLNGNSVFHANANRDFHLLEISVIITILLLLTNFVVYGIRASKRNMLITMFIMIYCTIYLSVMQEKMNVQDYLFLFVIGMPTAFLLFAELYRHGRILQILYRIVDVLCVLSVVSLVFWYLGVVAKVITPNGYVEINWGTFSRAYGFYGVHYAFQLDTTFFPDLYLYRNSGIFAEAPMFNLWLDLSLAIELFLKNKPSRFRVVLLGVTIITTLSVTGIIFMVICVALVIIQVYHKLSRQKKGLVLLGVMLAIPVMGYFLVRSLILKSDTQSYDMRLSDYVGGVKLWMNYPVFGAGYGSLKALLPYIYSPEGVLGISNSIAAVLGTGGIWMAILFYFPHFGALSRRMTGHTKISCFGLCYLFLFCTTAYFGRFLAAVMLAFELALLLGSGDPFAKINPSCEKEEHYA